MKRWMWPLLVFLLGAGLGLFVGSGLGYRRAAKDVRKEQANRAIGTALISMSSIARIENEAYDRVINEHGMFLFGSFLELIELHKSGRFDSATEKHLVYALRNARTFIEERPAQFTGPAADPSLGIKESDSPGTQTDPEIEKKILEHRALIRDAFNYVDRLPDSKNGTSKHR